MITLFNYWHYIVLFVIFLIFMGGVYLAFQEEDSKTRRQIIFSFLAISIILAGLGIYVVDMYTKKATLYRLENKRNLNAERIMFTGIVKNEGKHEIGKVVFEIRLVNKGNSANKVKSGEFFKPSGFSDFFSNNNIVIGSKPQQIVKEFVVAQNLKPGESKDFRVYFDYPPYFSSSSNFPKIYAH